MTTKRTFPSPADIQRHAAESVEEVRKAIKACHELGFRYIKGSVRLVD